MAGLDAFGGDGPGPRPDPPEKKKAKPLRRWRIGSALLAPSVTFLAARVDVIPNEGGGETLTAYDHDGEIVGRYSTNTHKIDWWLIDDGVSDAEAED